MIGWNFVTLKFYYNVVFQNLVFICVAFDLRIHCIVVENVETKNIISELTDKQLFF